MRSLAGKLFEGSGVRRSGLRILVPYGAILLAGSLLHFSVIISKPLYLPQGTLRSRSIGPSSDNIWVTFIVFSLKSRYTSEKPSAMTTRHLSQPTALPAPSTSTE
ncbi:hypothetical protein BKA83DRAFT_159650 [Pisolithus microcarpus]|nr:hypothetical protein BKA83DRAFT_159650 [Pisolithus microcarpus]